MIALRRAAYWRFRSPDSMSHGRVISLILFFCSVSKSVSLCCFGVELLLLLTYQNEGAKHKFLTPAISCTVFFFKPRASLKDSLRHGVAIEFIVPTLSNMASGSCSGQYKFVFNTDSHSDIPKFHDLNNLDVWFS